MTELARVEGRDHDGFRLVRISGEIDLSNVNLVMDAIAVAVPGDASRVVLDLSDTAYLDSSGIAMLFRLAERLGHRRQEVRLVVPPDAPARAVLELTRVETVIRIADTVDELEGSRESPA
jgi:anti-anti-sigma factor